MFLEEPPERDRDVLSLAVDLLQRELPKRWSVDVQVEARAPDGTTIDAMVELTGPSGPITLIAEVKRSVVPRDVPGIIDRLRQSAERLGQPKAAPTIVGRYLSANTQAKIQEVGACYLDATGNIRIVADEPLVLLRLAGADRDPWRGPGRPRGSLKGAPAARVVRGLVDYTPPFSVPELIDRSGASTGATYRVVQYLEEQDLITREELGSGAVVDVRWRQLLEAWSSDYGFDRADVVRSFIEPRGLDTILGQLSDADPRSCVVTGTFAAREDAPYAPARLLTMYVRDLAFPEAQLGLRPVESGANVLVAANKDDFAFDRSRQVGGVNLAARSQVVVDLMSGPGRNPAEAQELLTWMEGNMDAWRD